jgi:tRNA pseudouridine38-40 synthase
MNDSLPYDINIMEVEKTHHNFHARHDAVKRSYIYQISTRRTAFGKNYVWWIKDKLDFRAMEAAAKQFAGMHDFVSFSDQDPKEKSTKVLIDDIQFRKEGDIILIRITGSHFLWKMVRRIVGVLAEVGRGKLSEADLKIFLITRSKEPAKYTAPPSGLFLEKVLYKGDKLNDELHPVINI